MGDVTQILFRLGSGDAAASAELLPLVYDELRRLAAAKLAQEKPGQTLQATALVHEAYLRLAGHAAFANRASWNNRAHFFATASEAMRRILIESARRKNRIKRGRDLVRNDVPLADIPAEPSKVDIFEINEALTGLEAEHQDAATVVKLRYFVGLTLAECADALDVSIPTVERRWRYARAWLTRWLLANR